MPLYNLKCPACGNEERDVFARMNDTHTCDVCSGPSERVPVLTHTDLKAFRTPIDMYSIAMEDPSVIREFKRKAPDVECSDDPANEMYGVPIATSRKAKLQALAAVGYTER